MIVTVTLNTAVDRLFWVDRLRMRRATSEEFLIRATNSDTSAGGKGVNVSIFLARMGVENVAMGFVGGHVGHIVIQDLREEGVTTNFVWTEGETRTNVTILEKGREHIPILIDEAGTPVSERDISQFMRRYKLMAKRATWVVLAGSLPPGVDADLYYELASIAKKAGAKVVVSTRGKALNCALEAVPFIVKPDTREHLSMENVELNTPKRIIAAGKGIVESGVSMVIVSHEVTGDIVITRDAIWKIRARVETTHFKNLVGADDVLLGGIIYKLDKGDKLEDALKFGMAAGILSAESEEKICKDIGKINEEMKNISLELI